MKLNLQSLKERGQWAGFKLPVFDIEVMRKHTFENPAWLHFGAGNIFRAFPAVAQQALLNEGISQTGIIVCEAFDEEIIDKAFVPYDNLTIAATLKKDSVDKEIVASVSESIKASVGMGRLRAIFAKPSLQIVSFTITEKGYAVTNSSGAVLPYIAADMESGPDQAKSLMGIVAALCFARFLAGKLPLSLVSMDNCAENGAKLKNAVMALADAWRERGFVPAEFCDYIQNDSAVAFPWTMIDKITPSPSDIVAKHLREMGCEGMDIELTAKRTYAAPFVNAEETQYLIIEDAFPNGRPALEKAGLVFADRDTVTKVEKMKVGACLNPLHSILAIFGCLLKYRFIHEAMNNQSLVNLITRVGYKEALPYVPDPGIVKPEDFLRKVIEVRFPNPYIPDMPQRIAADTSQKIPVRFGETLKRMIEQGDDVSALTGFPFFFAGWLRYLLCIDDEGVPFEPSPDPMLAELKNCLKGIAIGCKGPFTEAIRPILSNKAIFGIDLYDTCLADKTEEFFKIFVQGTGAVGKALDEYFKEA